MLSWRPAERQEGPDEKTGRELLRESFLSPAAYPKQEKRNEKNKTKTEKMSDPFISPGGGYGKNRCEGLHKRRGIGCHPLKPI